MPVDDQNKDDQNLDDQNKDDQNQDDDNKDDDKDDLEVKYTPEELTKKLVHTADEAKKYRQKMNDERKKRQELEAQLKKQETDKLAEQGKWKEHSEALEKELEAERDARKKDRESYATEGVISIVQREAVKLGVTNETDLADLVALAPWNELEVDENFRPKTEDVKKMLLEQKKLRPRLFTGKKITIHDTDPGKDGGQKGDNREEYLKELKKCKTQKEFDEVRKKYGHVGL